MSLEDLTDSIVQLCEECNVWSSTINIPRGNGDILDISAACGSQACTPVIGHDIGGKYIPIMARLTKVRRWSKR
jgi:hypothetical protein